MKRSEIKLVFLGLLLVILAIFVIVAYFSGDVSVSNNIPDNVSEDNYCDPDNRPQNCIEIYRPACGWDLSGVQVRTFSNECYACSDSEVAYWTSGEC